MHLDSMNSTISKRERVSNQGLSDSLREIPAMLSLLAVYKFQ